MVVNLTFRRIFSQNSQHCLTEYHNYVLLGCTCVQWSVYPRNCTLSWLVLNEFETDCSQWYTGRLPRVDTSPKPNIFQTNIFKILEKYFSKVTSWFFGGILSPDSIYLSIKVSAWLSIYLHIYCMTDYLSITQWHRMSI